MSDYTDGFVLPLPKDKVDDYKKMAGLACTVWMQYGALDYREWIIEDEKAEDMVPFPQLAGAKKGETTFPEATRRGVGAKPFPPLNLSGRPQDEVDLFVVQLHVEAGLDADFGL